jgi:hypothetical protein
LTGRFFLLAAMKTETSFKRCWPGLIILALLAVAAAKPALAGTNPLLFLQGELMVDDGVPGDDLGHSVAINKDTLVVGAASQANNAGAAYVFIREGGVWHLQAKLTTGKTAPDDHFGISVAVDGETIVVGAIGQLSFTGAAYVFVRQGATWRQQAMLTPSEAWPYGYFGVYVGISGDTAVIAADGYHSFTGAAYVFVRDGEVWRQQARLAAGDPEINGYFGHSVSIDKDTIAVGADGQQSFTGAAYVFTRSSGAWTQQARLSASDGQLGDYFGHLVAVSGDTVVAGADNTDGATGAAYVFRRDGGTWYEEAKLAAADAQPLDHFGWSVAISGQTAVIGSWGKLRNTGAAYVFGRDGDGWRQQARLMDSDGGLDDHFGWQVDVSGDTFVVTAVGRDNYAGAAYVFGGPLPPVIGDEAATVSGTRAGLSAKLVSLGTAESVSVFFEYGLSAAYSQTTSAQEMNAAGPFTANISGLEPGRTYHFRAVAVGDHGEATGSDMVLRTGRGSLPVLILLLACISFALAVAAIVLAQRRFHRLLNQKPRSK